MWSWPSPTPRPPPPQSKSTERKVFLFAFLRPIKGPRVSWAIFDAQVCSNLGRFFILNLICNF